MRKLSPVNLVGYAVFAALFLAVAALRPAHGVAADTQTHAISSVDAKSFATTRWK